MTVKCPGQDFRWLTVETHKCPNCGTEEEIFSNEMKVKCRKCGDWIYKEKLPSCIDWCSAARECIGEGRWQQWNKEGEKNDDQDC